jgi:hypothetical protein
LAQAVVDLVERGHVTKASGSCHDLASSYAEAEIRRLSG